MIFQNPTPASGSSIPGPSIRFELEPPTSVRPCAEFTLPVIVAVNAPGIPTSELPLSVHVELTDENHEPIEGCHLSGYLTDNIRNWDGDARRGYAKFDGLAIDEAGRYRLRILLLAWGMRGQVTVKAQIDSEVIHVHEQAGPVQRPTYSQVSTLRRLIRENLQITEEDIQEWQNAS
ncbi:hypothetical protein VTN02DRAFT_1561 [Thermoascus thermophilus]